MKFQEWQDAIKNELIAAGFQNEYAKERTLSVRGFYYSEHQHPAPECVAKKLVDTCKTGFTNEEKYINYCKKNKLKPVWI